MCALVSSHRQRGFFHSADACRSDMAPSSVPVLGLGQADSAALADAGSSEPQPVPASASPVTTTNDSARMTMPGISAEARPGHTQGLQQAILTTICMTVNIHDMTRRITANLPGDLLEEATAVTGKGITETLIAGLELVRRSRARAKAAALKGKLALDIDLDKSRERDRR